MTRSDDVTTSSSDTDRNNIDVPICASKIKHLRNIAYRSLLRIHLMAKFDAFPFVFLYPLPTPFTSIWKPTFCESPSAIKTCEFKASTGSVLQRMIFRSWLQEDGIRKTGVDDDGDLLSSKSSADAFVTSVRIPVVSVSKQYQPAPDLIPPHPHPD
ncbi:hypothetical protein PM082_006180 [Marasmius tenuissimus]|nr:hypothetical protein PM082_006180 [Marasmius tenuissimus]